MTSGFSRAETSVEVLVVADDAVRRQSIASGFSGAGFVAREAGNCLEAIRAVSRHRPDLVALDLHASVLAGAQTARILRSLEKHGRRVPILAAPPAAEREREGCLAAGVDRFLPLPSDRESLRKTMVELAMEATRRPGSTSVTEDAAAGRRAAAIDLTGTLSRLGGDESLLADLTQFFFEDAFGLLVEMHQSIARESWDEARRAAHSLKGLASNFGAGPAVAALQAVEMCDRSAATAETAATMNQLASQADEEILWLAAALAEHAPSDDHDQS